MKRTNDLLLQVPLLRQNGEGGFLIIQYDFTLLTAMFSMANFKDREEETLGAARPQFRSLNRRKSYGHCLFRLISPPMRFPPQAVIGGSSCARSVTALDPQLAK